MSDDIKEKLKDYLNQYVNDYLRESSMNSNGTWATNAEIMATASLLGIDIVVHSKVADRMEWLRYPASFSNERTGDFLQSTSKTFQNTLILLSVYSNKYCLYTWQPECPSKALLYCIYCN